MATKTQTQEYQFQGNPIDQDVPRIGNLVYDERGEEVLALHNEKFRGNSSIEDTTDYKKDQPLSYSNVPRALSYAQLLRERFPDMHILSPEEVVRYWDSIPERDDTYADTNSIVIYPNEGYNENLRQRVLDLAGKQKTKVPLVVSGLDVERADNDSGFTFTETEATKAEEAPYLEKDGRVNYDGTELVQSEEGVPVWVSNDQSGLHGLFRGRSGGFDAGDDDLLGSNESGRVQVFYDPQGRVENLEARIKELQQEKEKLKSEIDSRFLSAVEYLRTGKLQPNQF